MVDHLKHSQDMCEGSSYTYKDETSKTVNSNVSKFEQIKVDVEKRFSAIQSQIVFLKDNFGPVISMSDSDKVCEREKTCDNSEFESFMQRLYDMLDSVHAKLIDINHRCVLK